ncbi:uncharacterized protein LOC144122819 [Amblyomma americanum]
MSAEKGDKPHKRADTYTQQRRPLDGDRDGVTYDNLQLSSDRSLPPTRQLKDRKALEGHNFLTSGWVREPCMKTVVADTVILKTQVNHSQSLNKPPVDVWVLAESDGHIVSAHCTCMAGNGEACSRVAALLFYVECGVRARQEQSCTDGPNAWLPATVKTIGVRPVSEMDLS